MGDLIDLPDDMTQSEKESLADYIEHGCPGLLKATESDIHRWFRLYMSGKTYNEIAGITKEKRDLILYVSHKSKWMELRMDHYGGLLRNMQQKIANSKLESANTMATMISAMNRYYGDKFDKFLANNDKSIIEGMDTKMLSQYHKLVETLDKLISASVRHPSDKQPTVNINMSGGTVKQVDGSTVEVTSEEVADSEAHGDILKILAEYKKKSESKE